MGQQLDSFSRENRAQCGAARDMDSKCDELHLLVEAHATGSRSLKNCRTGQLFPLCSEERGRAQTHYPIQPSRCTSGHRGMPYLWLSLRSELGDSRKRGDKAFSVSMARTR